MVSSPSALDCDLEQYGCRDSSTSYNISLLLPKSPRVHQNQNVLLSSSQTPKWSNKTVIGKQTSHRNHHYSEECPGSPLDTNKARKRSIQCRSPKLQLPEEDDAASNKSSGIESLIDNLLADTSGVLTMIDALLGDDANNSQDDVEVVVDESNHSRGGKKKKKHCSSAPSSRSSKMSPKSSSSLPRQRYFLYRSSRPVTLLALSQNQQDMLKTDQKSCLKQQPRTARNGGTRKFKKSAEQKKKTVTFATSAYSERVWCFIKTVDYDDCYDLDGQPVEDCWWSARELNEIRRKILSVAPTLGDSYGPAIRMALDSAKTATTLANVKLCLATASRRALVGRGLESVVTWPMITNNKSAHREAVLKAQTLLWNDAETARSNDIDLEVLRKESLKHSKPSRLMSLKLAELDRYQA